MTELIWPNHDNEEPKQLNLTKIDVANIDALIINLFCVEFKLYFGQRSDVTRWPILVVSGCNKRPLLTSINSKRKLNSYFKVTGLARLGRCPSKACILNPLLKEKLILYILSFLLKQNIQTSSKERWKKEKKTMVSNCFSFYLLLTILFQEKIIIFPQIFSLKTWEKQLLIFAFEYFHFFNLKTWLK